MGYRFRRSINLGGGFRINVSKSGIGYSWGVPGFRVTKTARGTVRTTYSIPGTGISYVEESGKRQSAPSSRPTVTPEYAGTEIKSADIAEFKKAEIGDISSRIERSISLNKTSYIFLALSILVFAHPMFLFFPALFIALQIWLHSRGYVYLDYSMDTDSSIRYQNTILAWELLSKSQYVWQILTQQSHYDTRRTAGAGKTVTRNSCRITHECPYYLRSNVEPVSVALKGEQLIVLPDKILLLRGGKVAAIDYNDVDISFSPLRFIEDGTVPSDSNVVGYTWRFVNNNGTPDRRFNNNRQLPVCIYGEVFIKSSSGLNIILHISNEQIAREFSDSFRIKAL